MPSDILGISSKIGPSELQKRPLLRAQLDEEKKKTEAMEKFRVEQINTIRTVI
jgi:hypothetical protein